MCKTDDPIFNSPCKISKFKNKYTWINALYSTQVIGLVSKGSQGSSRTQTLHFHFHLEAIFLKPNTLLVETNGGQIFFQDATPRGTHGLEKGQYLSPNKPRLRRYYNLNASLKQISFLSECNYSHTRTYNNNINAHFSKVKLTIAHRFSAINYVILLVFAQTSTDLCT